MGFKTEATGNVSTAMGNSTTASGNSSVAMGKQTKASGYYSTAMVNSTTASGYYSTAMGNTSIAKGYASLTIGQFNDANRNGYNTAYSDTNYAFVIGNGTSSGARSDALNVKFNGDTNIAGVLTANSNTYINGTLTVSSNTDIAGTLTANGGKVLNTCAIALGCSTTASGDYSTAMVVFQSIW